MTSHILHKHPISNKFQILHLKSRLKSDVKYSLTYFNRYIYTVWQRRFVLIVAYHFFHNLHFSLIWSDGINWYTAKFFYLNGGGGGGGGEHSALFILYRVCSLGFVVHDTQEDRLWAYTKFNQWLYPRYRSWLVPLSVFVLISDFWNYILEHDAKFIHTQKQKCYW